MDDVWREIEKGAGTTLDYTMAHPDSGELVPPCVQHCVLDPVENIELRRLLPIVHSPGTRAT